jgi:hypothetical protein
MHKCYFSTQLRAKQLRFIDLLFSWEAIQRPCVSRILVLECWRLLRQPLMEEFRFTLNENKKFYFLEGMKFVWIRNRFPKRLHEFVCARNTNLRRFLQLFRHCTRRKPFSTTTQKISNSKQSTRQGLELSNHLWEKLCVCFSFVRGEADTNYFFFLKKYHMLFISIRHQQHHRHLLSSRPIKVLNCSNKLQQRCQPCSHSHQHQPMRR